MFVRDEEKSKQVGDGSFSPSAQIVQHPLLHFHAIPIPVASYIGCGSKSHPTNNGSLTTPLERNRCSWVPGF